MNSPASIRARLLNVSKDSGEDFQAILTRYVGERPEENVRVLPGFGH